jgi:chromosome segregation ATPase
VSGDVVETLARWAQRDAAIGLDAELTEARAALAARDTEIADLRERNERLAQHVAQLVTERDTAVRQVAALGRPPLGRRVASRAQALAARLTRRGS